MNIESSTSSDSEIESKIKLTSVSKAITGEGKCVLNYQACVFCQKAKNLISSKECSKKTFIQCTRSRIDISSGKDSKWNHLYHNFNELKSRDILWHKSCYKSYTSAINIASYKSKFQKVNAHFSEEQLVQTFQNQRLTIRGTPFDINKCVFCQKRQLKQKLCQVMTKNMQNKINEIARYNALLQARLSGTDLIAAEIKYHAACVSTELRNIQKQPRASVSTKRKLDVENEALEQLLREMEKGLDRGKGYTTVSACKRYRELDGKIDVSDRILISKISEHFGDNVELIQPLRVNEPRIFLKKRSKEHYVDMIIQKTEVEDIPLFLGVSELQTLHKICQSIKTDMDQIPAFTEFPNLKIDDYKKHIPSNLYFLISLLVCKDSDDNKKEIQILNICQDIIFAFSNGKKYTPKHIGLGMLIHQETRSKKLVEATHACGHSISYIDTLRIRNSIAQKEIQLYLENDQVTIPRQLVPNRFVQFAADNIDILEETLDKAPTFHGTQMAAFQRGPVNEVSPGKFEFLPYKIKLSIPDDFHSLENIQYNKSKKRVLPETNKNIITEKGENLSYATKFQNIAWIMCRLADSEKENALIPQWSGFHKLVFENNAFPTLYGYLPLLPHVSSDYDTVWTVMKRCNAIARKLNNKYTVITFDQAIYYKAKELQWNQPEVTSNLIIRLGGFHITMNFLKVIGQYMTNSGLSDVWLESGLYGQSTIEGILGGKKYNKAIRAHKLTYESLMRVIISLFSHWLVECKSPSVHCLNLVQLFYLEIRNSLERKEDVSSKFMATSNTVRELLQDFPEFIESQTATFKYWYSYTQLVEILLEFQFAERSGNWELHLNSFRKMLPWFFAFNHTNYSRWGTTYLLDMYKLPDTAPVIYEEFMKGNFVIKRLQGNFNQLSVDQALEHINKNSKDAGGIVGLTKNSTKLDEWFLSYNVVGMLLDEFRSSLNITSNCKSQNIECGTKRMKADEDSVQKLQGEFTRFNVFSRNDDRLVVISTSEVASPATQEFLLTAKDIGENAVKSFLCVVGTPDFYKPLKKINVQTFQHTTVKQSAVECRKSFQKGQEFLQKILSAKEMGRNINYEDIFKFELTMYPMALAPNGVILTPSNKSDLGDIIESFTSSEKSIPIRDHKTCHIIDGMALVQSLGKPAGAKSFGDYANTIKSIVFRNPYSAQRIDFVFDHYKEDSIKMCTRKKRGLKETIQRNIDSVDTMLPQQWHLFIHSIFNKGQLTDFLSKQLYENSLNLKINFVTSGGFRNVLEYKANYDLIEDLLVSTQEEADTRIILHILSAKREGYTRCIVDCKDTDVLVLLVHFRHILTLEIWMRVGVKQNQRFIPIHDLNMDLSMTKCLPAFHALTGCDTTSQFAGLGKKSCWKTFVSHYSLLAGLGVEHELSEETFKQIEKFVIHLYSSNENVSSINSLRGILAASRSINKLPPTLDSLRQHCLRAHYQTKIWLNSPVPQQETILPEYERSGWKLEEGKLAAVLSTQSNFPEVTSVLSTCNCKKGCTGSLCSCKRKEICCISSCKCMAQPTCANKIQSPERPISPVSSESSSE